MPREHRQSPITDFSETFFDHCVFVRPRPRRFCASSNRQPKLRSSSCPVLCVYCVWTMDRPPSATQPAHSLTATPRASISPHRPGHRSARTAHKHRMDTLHSNANLLTLRSISCEYPVPETDHPHQHQHQERDPTCAMTVDTVSTQCHRQFPRKRAWQCSHCPILMPPPQLRPRPPPLLAPPPAREQRPPESAPWVRRSSW